MIPLKLNSDTLEFRRVAGSVELDPLVLPKVEIAACPERREETNHENQANHPVTSRLFPSRLQVQDPPGGYGGQVSTCLIPRRIRLSKTSGLSLGVRLGRK